VVLATKQLGEAGGLFACGRHGRTIARVFGASVNARGRPLARDLAGASRTGRGKRERSHGECRRIQGGDRAQAAAPQRFPRTTVASAQLGLRHSADHCA
jgi:hypothetical protein